LIKIEYDIRQRNKHFLFLLLLTNNFNNL